MPQLRLTFEEIADVFCCDTAVARRRVIATQWERRRYNDGLTRAQLPPEVAHEFMLRIGVGTSRAALSAPAEQLNLPKDFARARRPRAPLPTRGAVPVDRIPL
jgi:hypothetical protein